MCCECLVDAVELAVVNLGEGSVPVEDCALQSSHAGFASECNHLGLHGVTSRISRNGVDCS